MSCRFRNDFAPYLSIQVGIASIVSQGVTEFQTHGGTAWLLRRPKGFATSVALEVNEKNERTLRTGLLALLLGTRTLRTGLWNEKKKASSLLQDTELRTLRG